MANYPQNVYPWYLLDIIVFWVFNFILIFLVKPNFTPILNITFLDLLIYGLAVYRIANLTSNEEVTKVIRAPFVVLDKKDNEIKEVPREEGFRGFLGSLLYCPSCSGLWWAAILTESYLFFPAQIKVLFIIFALSGFERLFTAVIGTFQKLSR